MHQRRTLLVLRHAQTEDVRPGIRDSERRLTPDGERDAQRVCNYLREHGITIATMICSTAALARRTLELLKLGDQLDPDRVEIANLFYNAGGDTWLNAVRELPDDCHIGDAPAAPGSVHELTDPATPTPKALAAIESRFPACAMAQLQFDGDWASIDTCSLLRVRLPASANA